MNKKGPSKRPELQVGDEIDIIIRGVILERGSEFITVNPSELRQQGKIDKDISLYVPYEAITSEPIREHMPHEVPS